MRTEIKVIQVIGNFQFEKQIETVGLRGRCICNRSYGSRICD